MKPYLAPNRVPILGMILLVSGSIILGVVIGALAYFISNFIYYIVIFSLAVGGAAMIAYYKLLQFAKVRHSMIAASMGFMTGIFIGLAYYGSAYLVLRSEFIADAQKNHNVNAAKASQVFNKILVEETGSSGILGYMKFRAKEGDQYTNYFMENGLPIHEFSFTLKSAWAWLYWFLEVLFFSLPTAWIGYDVGKRAFSESANDWYDPLPKQISAVPMECKEQLLTLLKRNSLQEISELVVAEEKLAHPMIEIYEQRSNNKRGDILLSVKQTFRDKKGKIKRNIISQWEVSEQNYASFINMVTFNLKAG